MNKLDIGKVNGKCWPHSLIESLDRKTVIIHNLIEHLHYLNVAKNAEFVRKRCVHRLSEGILNF